MTKSSLLNFEIPVRWSQSVAGSSTWPRNRHLIAGHSSASSTCWPRTPDPDRAGRLRRGRFGADGAQWRKAWV